MKTTTFDPGRCSLNDLYITVDEKNGKIAAQKNRSRTGTKGIMGEITIRQRQVSGQPLPLCRSNAVTGEVSTGRLRTGGKQSASEAAPWYRGTKLSARLRTDGKQAALPKNLAQMNACKLSVLFARGRDSRPARKEMFLEQPNCSTGKAYTLVGSGTKLCARFRNEQVQMRYRESWHTK